MSKDRMHSISGRSVSATRVLGRHAAVLLAALALAAASGATFGASAQADVRVEKTGPTTASAGDTVTYTITLRNLGPNSATSVTATDTLPAGVTFVSSAPGGSHSGGVVTWTGLTVNPGFPRVATVRAILPSAGTYTNIAAATSPVPDPDPTNNNGSQPFSRLVTVVGGGSADVSVTKSGPANVNAGDTIRYVITTTNGGPSTADSVVVKDQLPAGVTFVSASRGGTESAGVVSFPDTVLLNAETVTDTVVVLAPATGMLTNTASATAKTSDPDATNNDGSDPSAQVATTVVEQADVSVTKSGPANVNAGDTIRYVITTTNGGPSTADSVVVKDQLPAGVTFVSASRGGTESAGVVSFPDTVLLNTETVTDTVVVLAPATGMLTNTASATAKTADPDATNNDGSDPSAQVATTVIEQADVSVTKTGPASVTVGATIRYVITTTNGGPSTADSVVVKDQLPAGVTFVSASRGGTESAGVVSFPDTVLLNTETVMDTVEVVANVAGIITNTASATVKTSDPDATNNDGSDPSAQVVTTVAPPGQADVSVTKSGPAAAFSGSQITYVITTRNNGPASATSVVVSDQLPAGVAFVSASRGGTVAGGVVTWPAIATLLNGATIVDTVIVTAGSAGTLLNVAMASSATTDPTPGNNDGSAGASRVTTVVSPPGGTVTGHVFDDPNGNGVQDPGEADLAGLDVRITPVAPGGATRLVKTDASGDYSASLPGGDAVVDIVNPAAQSATTGNDPQTVSVPSGGTVVATPVGFRVQADVIVTKAGPTNADAGAMIEYVITTTNAGPAVATAVVVSDALPGTVTFLSASRGGAEAGGVVTWPALPSLAAGASVVDTVRVVLPNDGTVTDVASAGSGTPDSDASNNDGSSPASRVTTVINPNSADVSVGKSGPATVDVGATVRYVITTSNAGPSPAAAVVVKDQLPAGLTFVSASRGGTEAGGMVTWPAITLVAGGSVTDTVVAVAAAAGVLTDVATASSGTPDPVPGNNDGSAAASRVSTTANPVPDFEVSLSPGAGTVPVGSSATFAVRVSSEGATFTEPVTLTCSGLPAGVACTFSPSVVTPGSSGATSTMTLAAAASAQPGASSFQVLGRSGTHRRSADVGLTVSVFDVSASPESRSAVRGGSASFDVSVAPVGGAFTGAVSLACRASSGASCAVSPRSVTPGTSGATATLVVSPTEAGEAEVTVTADAGGLVRTAMVRVETSDYRVAVSPAVPHVPRGSSGSWDVRVERLGGTGEPVQLSCEGLPAGASCSFSPATIPAGSGPVSSTLTVSTTEATPTDRSGFTVLAQAGASRRIASSAMVVTDFVVDLRADESRPYQLPAHMTVAVNAVGGSFEAPVTLSCSALPPGVSCRFSEPTLTPGAGSVSHLTLSVTGSATASGWTGGAGSSPQSMDPWLLLTVLGLGGSLLLLAMTAGAGGKVGRRRLAGATALVLALAYGACEDPTAPVPETVEVTLTVTGTSGNLVRSDPATFTIVR